MATKEAIEAALKTFEDHMREDGFKLSAGTYQFTLTICYSNAKTCQGGGEWETLTAPITVVVQ